MPGSQDRPQWWLRTWCKKKGWASLKRWVWWSQNERVFSPTPASKDNCSTLNVNWPQTKKQQWLWSTHFPLKSNKLRPTICTPGQIKKNMDQKGDPSTYNPHISPTPKIIPQSLKKGRIRATHKQVVSFRTELFKQETNKSKNTMTYAMLLINSRLSKDSLRWLNQKQARLRIQVIRCRGISIDKRTISDRKEECHSIIAAWKCKSQIIRIRRRRRRRETCIGTTQQ